MSKEAVEDNLQSPLPTAPPSNPLFPLSPAAVRALLEQSEKKAA